MGGCVQAGEAGISATTRCEGCFGKTFSLYHKKVLTKGGRVRIITATSKSSQTCEEEK
jgi:hypothetical protein